MAIDKRKAPAVARVDISMKLMRPAGILIVLLVALLFAGGCSGQSTGADIRITVQSDGAVEQHVTVRGIGVMPDVKGWSRETSVSPEFSATFQDPAELPKAEAELLATALQKASEELGYMPAVLDNSSIDVTFEDYLLFKAVEVTYRPPEIDFMPPHCLECDGKGRHDCEICATEGSLTCPVCDGGGSIQCSDCGGRGNNECESCSGAGHEECLRCEARGWNECSGCNGTGVNSWGDSCGWCGGDGRNECSACDGTGRNDCWPCDGSGRIQCRTCEARGQLECARCEGALSVVCLSCEGIGALTCGPCMGVGSPTSTDLAAYESVLRNARLSVSLDMPGFTAGGSDTSVVLLDEDAVMSSEITASSWVPNWPAAIASGGGVAAILVLGSVLLVRRVRRRSPARVVTGETDAAIAITSDSSDPEHACCACGTALSASVAFCTQCGERQ